MKLSKRYS